MANPNPKNGHIDIANEIADKLCSYRLNGQEWQIIWVIFRKTWGWLENPKNKSGPKKEMDRISLSQFEALTGINRARCHHLLKGLIEKRVIKKGVTQKCNTSYISYGFQKDFDKWGVLPKSATPVTQKCNTSGLNICDNKECDKNTQVGGVTQKCNRVLPKSATGVLPKSATTKDTITKDTITKDTQTSAQKNDFDQFWKSYPKKKSKGQARKTWEILQKQKQLPSLDTLLSSIAAQKTCNDWLKDDGRYIPHPSTWLNAEGWSDETINKIPGRQPSTELRPQTYAQGKDAEQRGLARGVLKQMEGKNENTNDGTDIYGDCKTQRHLPEPTTG